VFLQVRRLRERLTNPAAVCFFPEEFHHRHLPHADRLGGTAARRHGLAQRSTTVVWRDE
jgi:hypothetical protein